MTRKNIQVSVLEFAQAIGQLVRRARAASASSDLSWSETAILKRLSNEGPATTADLARAEGMRPQSMRTIIAELENMSMVERTPHATDGRQVNIQITAKGAALQKSSKDAKRTWLAQTIAQLDEHERATLFEAGQIIKRLVERDQQRDERTR